MMSRPAAAAFAAILRVTPSPASLAYTSPILRKLNSYGEVQSFKRIAEGTASKAANSLQHSEHRSYMVIFSSESALTEALIGSPFDVEVDHGLSRPEDLDPYNVFGLQDRKWPEPRSFTCQLKRGSTESSMLREERANTAYPRVKLVKDLTTGPLFKGLLDGNVPLGQLEGLATSVIPRPAEEQEPQTQQFKLMNMYRAALKAGEANASSEVEDEASGPPNESVVRVRYPVTHKLQRHSTDPRAKKG